MLNLQAIEEQLAKGDPALRDTYLKLKARLTQEVPSGEVVLVKAPLASNSDFAQYTTPDMVDDTDFKRENFSCSQCSKVCASNAGLKAHERKCNK